MVYFGECLAYTWKKMSILLLWDGVLMGRVNTNQVKLVASIVQPFTHSHVFCLLIQSVTDEVLESLTLFVGLPISPPTSTSFV